MKTSYIFLVVMFLQFVWVHTLITKRSGDIKKKEMHGTILVINFQYIFGTSIVYLHIII